MRAHAPWLVVVLAALAYPLGVLAGGWPSFPTRDDCVHPARPGDEIEAVLGRYDSVRAAEAARERALDVGFPGTEVEADGCGRVKVVLPGIPDLVTGEAFVAQARSVGFDVSLEHDR